MTNEPRINDRIRAREVRLIGADGSQLGIKSLPEALSLARELELDLVEVADKAIPPVVRIMDFGKYKYEASQRVKESRKHQASNALKEMKYRPKIGKADFDTKTRLVEKFLGEGHKVKVTIMFRGREVYHPELGRRILDNVAEAVGHVGRVEVASKLDGRNMTMVLTPDRKAQAAHARSGAGRTSRTALVRPATRLSRRLRATRRDRPLGPRPVRARLVRARRERLGFDPGRRRDRRRTGPRPTAATGRRSRHRPVSRPAAGPPSASRGRLRPDRGAPHRRADKTALKSSNAGQGRLLDPVRHPARPGSRRND